MPAIYQFTSKQGVLRSILQLKGSVLHRRYVSSLRSLLAGLNVKGDLLALIEGLEAIDIDCAEMDKVILVIFSGNETVTLTAVKPLNCTVVQNGAS